MDIPEDIIISDNPHIGFLENNIQRVRNEITNVEETIDFMNSKTDEILKEESSSTNGIELSTPILKLYRDQYVIWYQVKNKTSKLMKNFSFLLHWSSDDELTYISSMHPTDSLSSHIKELIHIDELAKNAFLVIIFDRPPFLETSSIQIDGFLSYCDEDGENFIDDIQPIVIKTSDISSISMKLSPLGDPDVMNLHSRLLCSLQVDLILKLPVGSHLPIALASASLSPIGPVKAKLARFYSVSDECFPFNETIVEVKAEPSNITEIRVYTRNVDNLFAFYHHLYQTMKPSLLVPSEYKSLTSSTHDLESQEKHLRNCLNKEIDLLSDFSKNSRELCKDYAKIKNELIDSEHSTDVAYVEYLNSQDS